MARGGSRRRGGRAPNVKKQPLPNGVWRNRVRAASVVEEGARMTRRLFALLELVGEGGVHVSSMCEVLAVTTGVLDPLLSKLTKSGRLVRVPAPRQFGPGGAYRIAKPQDDDAP